VIKRASRDHGEAVGRYIEMGYKAIRVQASVPGFDKAYGVAKGNLYSRGARSLTGIDRRCVESSARR
jgi:hypothetical protein